MARPVGNTSVTPVTGTAVGAVPPPALRKSVATPLGVRAVKYDVAPEAVSTTVSGVENDALRVSTTGAPGIAEGGASGGTSTVIGTSGITPGNGHFHVYLDGATGSDYLIATHVPNPMVQIPATTTAGAHRLTVSLRNDDHSEIVGAGTDLRINVTR